MKNVLLTIILTISVASFGQEHPIRIVTEEIPNRLEFYALNENETDLDILFELTGTNFRQSAAKPRYIRVPARSRVHMKTVVLLRGKTPTYSYHLDVKDSLSNRALKKEFVPIKVAPRKSITIYIPENCTSCDSLINSLTQGPYKFNAQLLGERKEIRDQLERSLGNRINLDTLQNPVINLGGKLYTRVDDYNQLLELLLLD